MVKNGKILITALDRSVTFAGVEELANHVAEALDERGGILDPMEIACLAELARQNGAPRPEVARIARSMALFEPSRPKISTPLDGRIAETELEHEAAEAALGLANEAWRVRARELEHEAAERLHEARGNPTASAGAAAWIEARRAEVLALEQEFRIADQAARMARARLNALTLASDRYRADAEVRVRAGGETLTLVEFAKWREQAGDR